VDANISTTYQRHQILVNSTATDRSISMCYQIVTITTSQVSEIYFLLLLLLLLLLLEKKYKKLGMSGNSCSHDLANCHAKEPR